MRPASRYFAIACAALLVIAGCFNRSAYNKGYVDGQSWASSHPYLTPRDTDVPSYDPNDPDGIFQEDYDSGFRHGVLHPQARQTPPAPHVDSTVDTVKPSAYQKGYDDGASWASSHPNQNLKDTDMPLYDPNDPTGALQRDYEFAFRRGVLHPLFSRTPLAPAPKERGE